MIGIIVTGHGSFGTGLTSGLKLLAGETEYYEAIDFAPEDSIEILTDKIERAIKKLEDCDSIAIFTDLTGGSPFNVSCRLQMADSNNRIQVAGGSNLPVVLQAYLTRETVANAAILIDSSIEAGKAQMVRFIPEIIEEDDCEYEE